MNDTHNEFQAVVREAFQRRREHGIATHRALNEAIGEAWAQFTVAPAGMAVIDPENNEQVDRLSSLYFNVDDTTFDGRLRYALREYAKPTPPKPEEPTGLGAVVEDDDGVPWVRCENAERTPHWYARNKMRHWPDVDAVRVLSEGVQP